ncbi:NYN domain-containing protein [Microcoleus sp. LEGE 07076]|uniref:NYN domain-containing protein n=1 Tax=Microcoleus sp. LEGE 07076 TaxID=915322 RepID=UPI001881672E|nr:NYN domain-containing protein [Microcoleus sp. LEGE 07076]MBE9186839.1 NYN domain-containing protein [Microcoleus sp. LEGE 07076]
MKNPRRSPDRFRHRRRSRAWGVDPSQAWHQQGFRSRSPLSSDCGESTIAPKTSAEFDRGIAILLLDAENLKLDINAEKFLASLCDYSLQVKIAFANWKSSSTSKLDAELYDRGYELIHVPGGANSADGKMIAFGAAILYRYRDVREVFVCSSDGLLNHLCNQLQNQGLTVFRVFRKKAVLSVENRHNGDTNYYSCDRETEIPTFEELANQVAELLKAEYQSIDERIARLSTLVKIFQERHALDFNSTTDSAALLHSAENEISLALKEFATPLTSPQNIEYHKNPETVPAQAVAINSLDALEKILLIIIEAEIVQSQESAISVVKIKKTFFNTYQHHADTMVKKFLANSSLIKFLQSRPSVFQMTLNGSEHQVAIARNSAASTTHSSPALEASVVKIVRGLTAQHSGGYISVTQVASEFHKQYGQPITKKLKSLHLGGNFLDFLQSCQTFKVKKSGKEYQVAIATSQLS